jgi:hypothetical protein
MIIIVMVNINLKKHTMFKSQRTILRIIRLDNELFI